MGLESGETNTKRETLLKLILRDRTGRGVGECTELEEWLTEGKFAFVVGPGCARLGWSDPEIIRPVAAAIVRCLPALEDAPDREFLARLAAKCGIDLTINTDSTEETEVEQGLRRARCGLVRLARVATARFAGGLERWQEPIVDWEAVAVPLATGQARSRLVQELKSSQEELVRLNALARDRGQRSTDKKMTPTRQDWADVHELLGIDSITRSLDALAALVQNGDTLNGPHIEWLTNLAWHAFRYAAPWPPSNDEVAFQLGVTWHTEAVTYLPDRSQSSQLRGDQTDAVETLRRIYEVSARSNARGWSDRDRLFDSLARLTMRSPGPLKCESPASPVGTGALFGRMKNPFQNTVSIVLSTSFDRLLEEACLRRIEAIHNAEGDSGASPRRFHSLVPVLRVGGARAEIRWVVGTFEPGCADRWRYVTDDSHLPLDSPTIVKLNGDPQLSLATVEDFYDPEDPDAELRPLVVVTEFQHLSVLMAESDMLEGLTGRGLPRNGRFILLAESIDEWSIRQRLFGQTMQQLWKTGTADFEAISINRRSDSVRHSLFSWVNIREYRGDLADVLDRLESKAKDAGAA